MVRLRGKENKLSYLQRWEKAREGLSCEQNIGYSGVRIFG